jgi:nicotinamidase-related amidase
MTDLPLSDDAVLVVVDVQRGFTDRDHWGERDNPGAEGNIASLLAEWRSRGRPVVFVRHDSADPSSPLHPSSPGNLFQDVVTGEPDLLVRKSVNSSFHGDPDLHAWLQARGARQVVVCGITTNHCCETTARVAGNLGYDTFFVLDATHTFDRQAPDGDLVPAATLARITATNLHGEFATVVSTAEVTAG